MSRRLGPRESGPKVPVRIDSVRVLKFSVSPAGRVVLCCLHTRLRPLFALVCSRPTYVPANCTGAVSRSGSRTCRFAPWPFCSAVPNEVVTREEFRQALWPDDVFVDFDRGISSAIKRLRDALGDSADNPIFIETIERHGYRWIAPVQGAELSAEDAAQSGGQLIPLPPPHASPRWKFIFALPVLALLFAVWIFRPSYRSAKAGSKTQSASSSSAGLPRHAANREAEEFYLKGRYYWEKRTPDSLKKAVDSFTQSIVHDPGYAPAYVGLADCYNLLREYTVMPASEAYPRALAAAKKAVELDDQSSEAHASLAFVSFFGMWDAATADREFRRSIDLNPYNAIAHHWYATYLECLRRYPEALVEIERARALEPASKSVLADKGAILFDSGRLPEAIALLRQMEENEPDFISPHRYLKFIYLHTGDYPRYLVEARSEAVLMHDNSALAIVDATEKGFATGGGKACLRPSASSKPSSISAAFCPRTSSR